MDGREARSRNYDQRFNDLDERVCVLEKGHNEQHRKLERLGDQFELLRRLFVEIVQQSPKCGCNELLETIICKLDEIAAALSGNSKSTGHFDVHVTEVQLEDDSMSPLPADTSPKLTLSSSAVRAKLTVVNPRKPDGTPLVSGETQWNLGTLTEPGALVLAAAPDGTRDVPDPNWVDPGDGSTPPTVTVATFSTYVNTPLIPAEGTKVGGDVIISGPQMADMKKPVEYGDNPRGHFTVEGDEVEEDEAPQP